MTGIEECSECRAMIFYAFNSTPGATDYLIPLDLVAPADNKGDFTLDWSTEPPTIQAPRRSDFARGKVRFKRHFCPDPTQAKKRGKVASI